MHAIKKSAESLSLDAVVTFWQLHLSLFSLVGAVKQPAELHLHLQAGTDIIFVRYFRK
jgi:hypothetical protein